MSSKRKPIPAFQNEAEERDFWERHDSADYVDWDTAARVRFPSLKPSEAAAATACYVTSNLTESSGDLHHANAKREAGSPSPDRAFA